MAKKPMRTAVGRGQDRAATFKAQKPIVMSATHDQLMKDRPGILESARRAGVARIAGAKAAKLAKESARIQKSGERMARMQAAAKAKQPK